MYTAYVEATEHLALEKDKNRLQTQYLDQILKEIEEKAPLLQQQRADYENALLNQVHCNLTVKSFELNLRL